jgi:hypothetical protein
MESIGRAMWCDAEEIPSVFYGGSDAGMESEIELSWIGRAAGAMAVSCLDA